MPRSEEAIDPVCDATEMPAAPRKSAFALELFKGIIGAAAECVALSLELCLGRDEPAGQVVGSGAKELGDVPLVLAKAWKNR